MWTIITYSCTYFGDFKLGHGWLITSQTLCRCNIYPCPNRIASLYKESRNYNQIWQSNYSGVNHWLHSFYDKYYRNVSRDRELVIYVMVLLVSVWVIIDLSSNPSHNLERVNRLHLETGLGWGTKAPFVNFSVSKIFYLAKVLVRFFKSHSYLTGVTAAQLQWHLSNINVMLNR